MPSLTLKNIPEELMDRLREVAERERRSITQQALYILEKSLSEHAGTDTVLDDKDPVFEARA